MDTVETSGNKPRRSIWWRVAIPVVIGLCVVAWLFHKEFNPDVWSQVHFDRHVILCIALAWLFMGGRDFGKEHMWLVYVAQFVKSTGVIVATGYMWALVPEVISYGEYTHGRRISGIVNALTGIFYKAGMALGGVVPGLVLAFVDFNASDNVQSPLAEQGILWLVSVIPAILLVVAIFIISKYDLDDDRIDTINKEIENRHKSDN